MTKVEKEDVSPLMTHAVARVFAPRVMQTEACHPIRPARHSWKYTFFTLPLTDVSTS